MKQLLIIVLSLSVFTSCSILDMRICKNYESDDLIFRKYSEATSSNKQLAEEKALLIAKQEMAVDVDNYILSKYNHQTFLEDTDFEAKITIARKTILNDITIACSRTVERKGAFKAYMAIEMSKSSIDKEVKRRLKEEII